MTTSDSDDWATLIEGLRAGSETATAAFYNRYRPLLEGLAAKNLESGIRRRVQSDEVAHSACRTFMRRVYDGAFDLEGKDALWNLLCAVTLAKLRKKVRFHRAQKRGLDREEGKADGGRDLIEERLAGDAPGPADAAEFADTFQHLMSKLDEEERRLVCLKLEQRTDEEVAEILGRSERTVRRLRKRIQERFSSILVTER